jgi:hypothetical protein
MNFTMTPLIRIVALAGLVVIIALGGTLMLLGRSHSATPTVTGARHGAVTTARTTAPVVVKKHATTPAAAAVTSKTTSPAAQAKKTVHVTVHKAATPSKTVAKHKATAHKTAKPKFRGNPVYADLPPPLQWQLAHNKVVVVSFYNPQSDVDAISVAEAHAGAVDAHAGYLLVNVLDDKVAGILTALLPSGGLLPEPGTLIYRAPGTIAVRVDGFADRDSIAQAATNAFAMPAATSNASVTSTP